ncbi:MAG: TolC family protein [bacterium]
MKIIRFLKETFNPMKVLLIIVLVSGFFSLNSLGSEINREDAVSSRLSLESQPVEDSGPVSMSANSSSGLKELIGTAFENNPGIRAARSRWQAAVEKYPQVKSLPDPVFSITHFPSPVETRLGANRNQFKFDQMIPGFGKLRLNGERTAKMAELSRLKYEIAVRDVITGLKVSYAELQYIQAAIVLTQKNKNLTEELLKVAEREYGDGKANLQDVLRAQSQLAQATYDLLLLEELRRTEQTRINSLLGSDPETPVIAVEPITPGMPDLDIESLYRLLETNRQEVLIADVEEEINYFSLGLARKQGKPDFSVGLMYSSISDAVMPATKDSGRDAWGVMLGVKLPIWRTKNDSAVREAEFNVQASKSTRQDLVNKSYSTVKNLYFKIRTSSRLVDLYEKTLLPQARKSIELSETWYNSGQASFSELLEAQSIWLNFELALDRARTDLVQDTARLEQAVGVSIMDAGQVK